MTTSIPRTRRSAVRCSAAVAGALALALLATGCFSDRARPPYAADPPPPVLRTSPPAPVPTGRAVASAAQFDRDPCAVASAQELGVALAGPYHLLAANVLRPDGPPSPTIASEGRSDAVGCGYQFVAPTDAAEAYHSVVVRVTRWTSGGAALMARCRTAVAAKPNRYRMVKLADEACLGPDAVLPFRIARTFYTVTVTAAPKAASLPGEDVSLGALTLAAATVVAPRLAPA
jgi:hypothetical protein